MKTKYITFGFSLTEGQKVTLANAARNGTGATIRLTNDQLRGEDNLGLTKGQANRVSKNLDQGRGMELRFTKTQLKKMTKMGGILPLLALLPLLFGGLGAAGAAAGGAAGIAKAVQAKQAASAAQAEQERHNREVEAELKKAGGKGLHLGKKSGGILPLLALLPLLFGGLTAAGGVAGGASAIADLVHKKQAARAKQAEDERAARAKEAADEKKTS